MQVFPTTEAVEVFANDGGSVTIKQVSVCGDADAYICIPVQYIGKVCKALREAAREAKEDARA